MDANSGAPCSAEVEKGSQLIHRPGLELLAQPAWADVRVAISDLQKGITARYFGLQVVWCLGSSASFLYDSISQKKWACCAQKLVQNL